MASRDRDTLSRGAHALTVSRHAVPARLDLAFLEQPAATFQCAIRFGFFMSPLSASSLRWARHG